MASKLVSLPSYVSEVPREPIELDEKSIIIEDEGVPYLCGHAASLETPNGSRIFGGSFNRGTFRRFVKAAVAAALGEGEHSISAAMSAAHESLDLFRDGPGTYFLNSENERLFSETVSEIRFKTDSSNSNWKLCQVRLKEKTFVIHECQSVALAIPNQLKNYFGLQLGHGDIQQWLILDGRPMRQALIRREGIAGAKRKFAELTKLSTAEAEKAWIRNSMPKPGGMNGETIDCSKEKSQAMSLHFSPIVGEFINAIDPYKDRIKNGILSGGGAKDDMVCSFLKGEVEASGYYILHKVSELPIKDERCDDPIFTCVHGLLSKAQLALDIGNNSLKVGLA
jgi:hypothetical protein